MTPHPSIIELLSFFECDHLPPAQREVVQPFRELAYKVMHQSEGAELTVCLRKLLEAKDCAVRASLVKEWRASQGLLEDP